MTLATDFTTVKPDQLDEVADLQPTDLMLISRGGGPLQSAPAKGMKDYLEAVGVGAANAAAAAGSAATATAAAATSVAAAASVAGAVQVRSVRTPTLVPLVTSIGGVVPVWLENGLLGVAGLADSFKTLLRQALDNVVLAAGVTTVAASGGSLKAGSLVPLVRTAGNVIPVWLENGLLAAAGLAPSLISAITTALTSVFTPVRSSPAFTRTIVATDGRSLWPYRGKIARIKNGQVVSANIGLTGDSWVEQTRIPQPLSTLLTTAFGKSGEGWISVNGSHINAIGLTKSVGWTLFDVTNSLVTPPAKGCGPDGFSLTTALATDTLSITPLTTTSLKWFYRDEVGAFRWRVDGGAWTTVTGTGSNAKAVVTISGLTNAAHTFEFDTTGNTGSVTFYGGIAERTTVAGVTLYKMGNGSAQAAHYDLIKDEVAKYSTDLALDALGIILATNEFANSKGTTAYVAGLTAMVTAHRSANPNLPIILIIPAQSNPAGAPAPPLSAYRDAALALAQASGFEFYSMMDEWGPWAEENTLGQWTDTLHISNSAGWRPARSLMRFFFGDYQ